MEESCFQCLQPIMERLLVTFEVESREGYYLTNIATGECPTCLNYIWNGLFGSVEEAYKNIVELYMSQGNLLCHKIECPDSLLLVNFFLQGIGFFIPQFCSLPCVWILSVLQN